MASAVFGAIGTAIGGPLGGYIGSALGGLIDQSLFGASQPDQEGPKLDDLTVTMANPGSPVPFIFGTNKVAVSILAAGLIEEVATTTRQGKGGGPTSTTYAYNLDIDYLIGDGPILGIGRIWADNTLVRGPRVDQEEAEDGDSEVVSNSNANTEKFSGFPYPDRFTTNVYDPRLTPHSLDRNLIPTWDGQLYTLNPDKVTFSVLDPNDFDATIAAHTLVYWRDSASGYYIPTLESHAYSNTRETNDDLVRTWDDYYNVYDAINDFSRRAIFNMTGMDNFTLYFGKDPQIADSTMAAALNSPVPAYINRSHFVCDRLQLDEFGRRPPNLRVEVIQSDDARIVGIIEFFMERAGIEPELYDTSALPDDTVESYVLGYQVSSDGDYRTALETLLEAFSVDVTDTGTSLVFTKKYNQEYLTIDYNDLRAAEAGSSEGTRITETYENVFNLPRSIHLAFTDPDRDYNTNVAHFIRNYSYSPTRTSLQLAAVLSSAYSKELCRIKFRDIWLESTKLTFSLPYSYFYLKPGDKLRIQAPKRLIVCKITSLAKGRNGVIEVDANLRDITEYNLDNSALARVDVDALYQGYRNVAGIRPVIEPKIVDVPPLRAGDIDQFGTYATLTFDNRRSSWLGANIQRKYAEDQDYQLVLETTTSGIAGTITEGYLEPSSPYAYDDVSEVTVRLDNFADVLSSITVAELFNNVNIAIIGNEVVAYKDAVLVSTGIYTLRNFIRGIKTIDPDILNTHIVGERFASLSDLDTIFIPENITKQDILVDYKFISVGSSIDQTDTTVVAIEGNILKPLPPVMLYGDHVGNDIVVSWTRQDRRVFGWNVYLPTVMSESSESYLLEVLDVDAVTVLRQVTVDTPSFTYTDAMQIADGTDALDHVIVRVAQISAVIGAGHPTTGLV